MFPATTRIRSGNRPRLAGPPRKTRANARSDSSSEDYIVPKKTGRAKKRDAPQADHSGDADTPQDGHDDTDQDSRDDADNADDANDANDTPQDGLGNPNISGITPPIPANLVEPVLAGHETHFHVVTSGTEVGIFTNRYVLSPSFCCFHLLTLYQEELQTHVSSANSLRLRHSRHGRWRWLITPNASSTVPS